MLCPSTFLHGIIPYLYNICIKKNTNFPAIYLILNISVYIFLNKKLNYYRYIGIYTYVLNIYIYIYIMISKNMHC